MNSSSGSSTSRTSPAWKGTYRRTTRVRVLVLPRTSTPSSVYFRPMLPAARTMGADASVSFGVDDSEPVTGVPIVAGGGCGGDVLAGAG